MIVPSRSLNCCFVVSSHQVRWLSCFRCYFLRQFDDNVFWLLFLGLSWIFFPSPGLLIFFMNKLMDAVENWTAKIGREKRQKNLVFKLRKHLLIVEWIKVDCYQFAREFRGIFSRSLIFNLWSEKPFILCLMISLSNLMMIITISFKIQLRLSFDVWFSTVFIFSFFAWGQETKPQPHLQQRSTREISEVIYDSRYFIVHVRRHTAWL